MPGCKALFDLFRAEWSRNAATGLYQLRPDSLHRLQRELEVPRECFYCLPQQDVLTLLGKPSYIGKEAMYDYLDRSCPGGTAGEVTVACPHLRVDIAATGVSLKVSLVGLPPNPLRPRSPPPELVQQVQPDGLHVFAGDRNLAAVHEL